jgi:hypothetical protein
LLGTMSNAADYGTNQAQHSRIGMSITTRVQML